MLIKSNSYEKMCSSMNWKIPEYFNMGVGVCDKQADTSPNKTALITENKDGDVIQYSFLAIKKLSDQFANLLTANCLVPGDKVAILLSQLIEAAIAHIAALKTGLISVPLFTLFGEDALEYRLTDSGARTLITDPESFPKVEIIRDKLPNLETVFHTAPTQLRSPISISLWAEMEKLPTSLQLIRLSLKIRV